jgi:hypothetical protein
MKCGRSNGRQRPSFVASATVARHALVVLAGVAGMAGGCRRKHIPVASVPELPYPTCEGRALPEGVVVASGHLRAGPSAIEQTVVERYELRDRGCVFVLTARQEWPLNVSDIEIVYDRNFLPLRAWKRMTLPGVARADGQADIRRYELRTPQVTITRRVASGPRTHEILRGAAPTVVIGPGRGVLTAWLRRARLSVGAAVREYALDMREMVEVIRPVTLRREADQYVSALGRVVRVYTVYGRECIYADDTDAVVADLAGMLPATLVRTPPPAPMPLYGLPDPVNTP